MKVYTYNDKVLTNSANGKWLKKYVDPCNPLGLPAKTIRIKTTSDVVLTPGSLGGATVKQALGNNVYDIEFTYVVAKALKNYVGGDKVLEVLGLNTEGLSSIENIFCECTALTSVPMFDLRGFTRVSYIFNGCSSLTSVPNFSLDNATLLDSMFDGCSALTSVPNITINQNSLTSVSRMFYGCTNIATGILSMYNTLSSKTYPEYGSPYKNCFTNCGSNTVTGAAELAQIPSSWGGTGA